MSVAIFQQLRSEMAHLVDDYKAECWKFGGDAQRRAAELTDKDWATKEVKWDMYVRCYSTGHSVRMGNGQRSKTRGSGGSGQLSKLTAEQIAAVISAIDDPLRAAELIKALS